jgi:Tfp pilus assembly protein PilO
MKKKIFKKNRLVILALSVMIGVAGYLNFNAGKRDDLLRQKAKETNADAKLSAMTVRKLTLPTLQKKSLQIRQIKKRWELRIIQKQAEKLHRRISILHIWNRQL